MAGKHIHIHLHDAAPFTPKTPGGFGGASAAKSHPEGFVQGVGPTQAKPKPAPEPFRGYDKSVKDAGTSEGAKKAAQTRKSGGGGSGPNTAALAAAAEERKRINAQKYGGRGAAEARGGSNLNQGLKYGPGINPNTPLRLSRDAGTSEGAKKAAQSRKAHSGRAPAPSGYVAGRIGQHKIIQGIGTRGGEWAAHGRGETKWFKKREHAEEHAHLSSEDDG